MNPFRTAIQLNNKGARLVQSGDVPEALHLFRQAVLSIQGASEKELSENADALTSPDALPLEPYLCTVPTHDDSNDGKFFVYSRPLELSADFGIKTPTQFKSVHRTLSLYVLFNLALACHQLGLASGKAAPLERAIDLYRMVMETPNCSKDDPVDLSVIRCLAFNNLAQIYYDLFKYEESLYYGRCMLELFEASGCLDDCPGYLSQREIEELLLNGMFQQPPFAAQAA